jgi:hypothetical protein
MLAWESCGRNGRKGWRTGAPFETIFKTGKPSSITFNVGAPTFLGIAMMLDRCGARGVSPLRGSGLFAALYPVLTHSANFYRTSGAGWAGLGTALGRAGRR